METTSTLTRSANHMFVREQNLAYDSYFYLTSWDETTGTIVTHQSATTAFPSNPSMVWDVPRGHEMAYEPGTPAAEYAVGLKLAAARHAHESHENTIVKGKTVKVVKGRKVPVGTVGTVGTVFVDKYKSSRWSTAYQTHLYTGNGDVHKYVSVDNLAVLGPAPFDREAATERIKATAARYAAEGSNVWLWLLNGSSL
jgi:hypothetical protein